MPSANPKLEKQASTEAADPIRQAITVIEHKIRNMEKRKVKIESYKDIQKNGKNLDHDQKTALAKYDELLQTLDITRELYKGIVNIANDFAKQQKKIARKEAIERFQQDATKVREVLLIQDTLMNMRLESAREDFLRGANGATKLSEEDLKAIEDFCNETMTKRRNNEENEGNFLQGLQKTAEHFVHVVDGKPRDFVGTTYLRIREVIKIVNDSGYLDRIRENATTNASEIVDGEAARSSSSVPATDESPSDYVKSGATPKAPKYTASGPAIAAGTSPIAAAILAPSQQAQPSEIHNIPAPETMLAAQNFPVQVVAPAVVAPQQQQQQLPSQIPVVAQSIPGALDAAYFAAAVAVTSFPPQNPSGGGSVAPQASPQMGATGPSVVAAPSAPISTVSPAVAPAPAAPPRINDVLGTPDFFFLQESELDSPEAPGATIVAHIPAPAANSISGATSGPCPVPTPGGGPPQNPPIPTQTFTNQNFAPQNSPAPAAPVQVIYSHSPAAGPQNPENINSHNIGGGNFSNPNPPPPIPMPPSHQQQNIVYPAPTGPGIASTANNQQQQSISGPGGNSNSQATTGFPAGQQLPTFDGNMPAGNVQQAAEQQEIEDKFEQQIVITSSLVKDADDPAPEWSQMSDQQQQQQQQQHQQLDEWGKPEVQDAMHISQQQAWGDQRSGGYKGRGGGRRSVSNGYAPRGRVSVGGYRGRGGGGGHGQSQGTYYRNDAGANYQNGYQPRNYSGNDGGGGGTGNAGGYNGGFAKPGGSRGGSRGGSMRGSGGGGRGTRGGNRGGNAGGGYVPRNKPPTAAQQQQ